ncbi:universal stress protein [soil metagenome]
MTNVLLPIDGSAYGKVITDFVSNHRWAPNTKLKLLHLIEPLADDVYPEAVWQRAALNAAKKMLGEFGGRISHVLPTVDICQIIRHGDPCEEILREATEWPADLIVLGSHSRHDANKTRLGSVSLSILKKAPSMVIVVRVPVQKIDSLTFDPARSGANEAPAQRKVCSE